jgi:hypothetical protein
MKVNDPKLANLLPSQVGGPQAAESVGEKHKKVEGGAAGGTDQVNLSTLGAKVRALDTESPERAAYLEKLANDVQAGRYQPDSHAVSKKIVSDALREPSGITE